MDSFKQINLFDCIVKIMNVKPLINSLDSKSTDNSLKRKNQNLETQFNYLFDTIFENTEPLEKIILPERIPILAKNIKELLYYNGIDISSDKEISKGLHLIIFGFILFKEYYYLRQTYDLKGIEKQRPNKLIGYFMDNNIKNLFNWFVDESPFNLIEGFSKNDLKRNTIDSKNISNWEKGKNAISSTSILKIRENLEEIAKSENLKDAQKYIDFFIYTLYIEACKVRIKKELEKSPSDVKVAFFVLYHFLKGMDKIKFRLFIEAPNNNIQFPYELSCHVKDVLKESNNIFTSFDKEKIYKKIFNEVSLKFPEFRIKEDSVQSITCILGQLFKDNFDVLAQTFSSRFEKLPMFSSLFSGGISIYSSYILRQCIEDKDADIEKIKQNLSLFLLVALLCGASKYNSNSSQKLPQHNPKMIEAKN